jgi:hypothetical protein
MAIMGLPGKLWGKIEKPVNDYRVPYFSLSVILWKRYK